MDRKKILKELKYALRFLPDRLYIQLYYWKAFKKLCDLKTPKTYNEKLNWLKLHDHNPLYTLLVDKYEVKISTAKRKASDFKNETCFFQSKTKRDLKSKIPAEKQCLKHVKTSQKAT